VRLIDLELIAQHAPREHSGAITAAQRAVTRAVKDFASIEAERSADDVIVAMRSMVHAAMAKELNRVRNRNGDEVAAVLQNSLHRVEREILHIPTVRSRQLTREGRLDAVEHALQVLFGLSTHEDNSLD
jgi:glutamyl-tRNA reductase